MPTRKRPHPLLVLLALVTFTVAPTHAQDPATSLPTIDFEVEVPAGTKGTVHVALGAPVASKPAWSPDALALVADARGVWRGSVTLAEPATRLEWKVTRGDWATVEKGESDRELANRVLELGPGVTHARAKVAAWADETHAARVNEGTAAVTSMLVDLGTWKPRKLPSARRVVACVPPGYEAPENARRRYPVLYVLDGQNQFEPARSFLGVVWGLDRALAAHAAAGHEPFIAIAIDNTPERGDEYLPVRDAGFGAGGKLEDLAAFIFDELKPAVDARFRTRPGPEDTGVLGSSFGGIAAFHLGWKHADRARRLGVVSPSLWVGSEETLRVVERTHEKPRLRIWLDMGTNEGRDTEGQRENVAMARSVRDALEKLGFAEGKDLRYLEVEGGVHSEGAWAARLADILRFLFP